MNFGHRPGINNAQLEFLDLRLTPVGDSLVGQATWTVKFMTHTWVLRQRIASFRCRFLYNALPAAAPNREMELTARLAVLARGLDPSYTGSMALLCCSGALRAANTPRCSSFLGR